MRVGDTVLVRLAPDILRPMIVSALDLHQTDKVLALRLNGTIFCEPEDHTTPAFRTHLGESRVHGRPQRTFPVAYGELLREGPGIGEWTTRPTNLPTRS